MRRLGLQGVRRGRPKRTTIADTAAARPRLGRRPVRRTRRVKPGDRVDVRINRSGHGQTLSVTLGTLSRNELSASYGPRRGLRFSGDRDGC
jgi:hypothetical protein